MQQHRLIKGREQNGEPGRSQSKARPSKDEYAFCNAKGHWKKNCLKMKKRDRVASSSYITEYDDNKSNFALSCISSTT